MHYWLRPYVFVKLIMSFNSRKAVFPLINERPIFKWVLLNMHLKVKDGQLFLEKKALFYFLSRCGQSFFKEWQFKIVFQKQESWKIEISATLSDKST